MRLPTAPWSKRVALGTAILALAGGMATAAPIAFDQPALRAAVPLQVSVPGVADGGALASNYAADGRNLSPALSWSAGPPQTRTYVVAMEDADATSDAVHWVAYAIPQGLTLLPRGLHNLAAPARPVGLLQGRNDHDSFGYSGPQPQPEGSAPHHYHFEVFALDRAPRLPAGATLGRVERAMAGHVVASGQLVLTYPPLHPEKPKAGVLGAPT